MNKLSRWILTKVEKFSEMLITKTELIPRIQQIILDHDLVKEINDSLNDVGLSGGFFTDYEFLKQKTCECIESLEPHVHNIDNRRYMFSHELEMGNKIAKSMAVVAKMSGSAYITYDMFASEGIKFDAIVMDTSMRELGENVYEFLKWHEIGHLELDHNITETKVGGVILSMVNEYAADRYALKHTNISIKDFIKMQYKVVLPFKGKNTLSKDELKTLYKYTLVSVLPRVANIILCKLGL